MMIWDVHCDVTEYGSLLKPLMVGLLKEYCKHSGISSNMLITNENNSLLNRSNNLPRSIPTTNSSTTSVVNNHRPRLICVHGASSPNEASSTINSNGSIYVMVTADSKGQLKLLVNRYHR